MSSAVFWNFIFSAIVSASLASASLASISLCETACTSSSLASLKLVLSESSSLFAEEYSASRSVNPCLSCARSSFKDVNTFCRMMLLDWDPVSFTLSSPKDPSSSPKDPSSSAFSALRSSAIASSSLLNCARSFLTACRSLPSDVAIRSNSLSLLLTDDTSFLVLDISDSRVAFSFSILK